MSKFWKRIQENGEARPTYSNWPQFIKTLIDTYQSRNTPVPQGVQKDAVQNGWDARTSKKGKDWGMRFRLHTESDPNWFAFTDWGTTGLTGRVLSQDDLDEDLPIEERWGRFDNLGFTKTGEDAALGARGQGKFIFVAASNAHRILYDSLRPDGSYRLGVRWVEKTDCKVVSFDDDVGRTMLAQYSSRLPPLDRVGTRIIIDDPLPELVDTVKEGVLARYLALTWWEILRNFGASIEIDLGDGTVPVRIAAPPDMELPDADTGQHLVMTRTHIPVKLGKETHYIAKLHVVASRGGPVAEDLRGIALQRTGMRVMTFQVPHIPADISARIHGYCRFEESLDREMKALEDPTHCEFNLRRGVGRRIREIIEKEVSDFAEKRLGAPSAPSVEAANQEAARRAMLELNRLAKTLGITLQGGGGGGGGGGNGGESLPLRVTFPGGLVFPKEGSARVDYGEAITAKSANLMNDLPETVEVKVRMFLLQKKTTHDETLYDKVHRLSPGSAVVLISPFALNITRSRFAKGEWVLKNRIVALSKFKCGERRFNKGDIVNDIGRRFWVEEDPPEGGVFEDVRPAEFQPPDDHLQHRVRPGSTPARRVLEYNTLHEAYKNIKSDAARVEEYIFERAAFGLIHIDLATDKPRLIENAATLEPSALFAKAAGEVSRLLRRYYG